MKLKLLSMICAVSIILIPTKNHCIDNRSLSLFTGVATICSSIATVYQLTQYLDAKYDFNNYKRRNDGDNYPDCVYDNNPHNKKAKSAKSKSLTFGLISILGAATTYYLRNK